MQQILPQLHRKEANSSCFHGGFPGKLGCFEWTSGYQAGPKESGSKARRWQKKWKKMQWMWWSSESVSLCDPEFCSPVYEHDQTTPSQLTSFALCSPHLHGTRIFASPIEYFEAAIAHCFNNLQYSLIAPIEKHGLWLDTLQGPWP